MERQPSHLGTGLLFFGGNDVNGKLESLIGTDQLLERGTSTPGIPAMISLKTLSKRLDAHRGSVQRWLTEAEIKPLALGKGSKGAIRYDLAEVEAWLQKRIRVTYGK